MTGLGAGSVAGGVAGGSWRPRGALLAPPGSVPHQQRAGAAGATGWVEGEEEDDKEADLGSLWAGKGRVRKRLRWRWGMGLAPLRQCER